MTLQQLLEKSQTQKIGKEPVVVFPLKDWQALEALFEEYQMSARSYRQSIAAARAQAKAGKLYELNVRTGRFRKVQR